MRRPFSLRGEIGPTIYPIAAAALILAQHAGVALAFAWQEVPLRSDAGFWLFPLRRIPDLPHLSPLGAALAFAGGLALSWILAALSFRRATWSRRGFGLSALAVVPAVQVAAVALLAFMPPEPTAEPPELEPGMNVAHVIQGVLAGVAIIVSAVLVSALTFGAYGWGLFVLTPFLVGVTTAYLANRSVPLEHGRTTWLVLAASMLGGLALMMFALEGLMCILLIAPLAAAAAVAGGALGRALATVGHRRGKPLLGVAVLPVLFALEAATPPVLLLATDQRVDIAAPTEKVWAVLTDDEPVAAPPGLVGVAGLAYPVRGRLLGRGVGAKRIGVFSTGTAMERVTAWIPERELGFAVERQPPAMEEMSPYRRVHVPHLNGYFDTGETRFTLEPLRDGGTRLTLRASHLLRIDPVLYWEPLARWAIRGNVSRVLDDIRRKAEARGSTHSAAASRT